MKKKVISIFVIITFIWANCYTAFATQTSSDYKAKATAAEANSKKAQTDLKQVEGQLDTALAEVSAISNSIENVESDIGTLNGKIETLNKSIEEKEKDLKGKETLLDERLAAAYINGGTSQTYMDALFSGGIVNFVSNYDMIKQIAEYDNNLINEVKETKTSLENQKGQVETAKADIVKKDDELKKLKSQKQEKVNKLSAEQKEIQNKIDEYDNEAKKMKKAEVEALAKEKAAAEAAKKKSTSSTSSSSRSSGSSSGTVRSGGRFGWPCPSSSRITSPYGYRIHPIYGTKKFHSGIDIGASSGSAIVAAESGTVILASTGYNGGYGNYIILSHGNGYTTRYAHCSSLKVKVGDTVSRGQTIATVGSTGASTGPHLHFEVRINGETQNPVNYL